MTGFSEPIVVIPGKYNLICMSFALRTTLLRLHDATHHWLQTPNERFVSHGPTSTAVPAQIVEFPCRARGAGGRRDSMRYTHTRPG